MALSADRLLDWVGLPRSRRVLLTQNDIYYKGALVNITTSGIAVVASDTANQGKTVGVMKNHVEVANGDTTQYAEVLIGRVWLPMSGAAQSDVDDFIYATADDTIAKTATNADPCGMAEDFRTGYLLVNLEKGLPKTALA